MAHYTTTCPFCQASFLINDEQLNLKGGKARCGQCNQVFQANEHLSGAGVAKVGAVSSNSSPTSQPVAQPNTSLNIANGSSLPLNNQTASAIGMGGIQQTKLYEDSPETHIPDDNELDELFASSPAVSKTSNSQAIMDDIKFDDSTMINDAGILNTGLNSTVGFDTEPDISDKTMISDEGLFEDNQLISNPTSGQKTTVFESNPYQQETKTDLTIADDMNLGNDIDTSSIFGDEVSSAFKDTMTGMPAVEDPFSFSIADQPAVTDTTNANTSDDAWLEKLLSEDGGEENAPTAKSKQEQSEDLMGFLEDIGAKTAQFSAISPAQMAQNNSGDGNTLVDGTAQINTRKIRKASSKGIGFGRIFMNLIWFGLSLVMLVALAAQYLYFNFDTFARDSEKRQWLLQGCEYVGCTVPNLNADTIAFKEVNTVDDDSGSALTFVVHNLATEPTLFPTVKVSLYKGDELVGANLIQPKQYLMGKHTRLTSSQPIDGKVILGTPKTNFDGIKLEPIY